MEQTQQIDSAEHAYWRGEWEREAAQESASELTPAAARAIAAQWAGWLPDGRQRRALFAYANTGVVGWELADYASQAATWDGLCLPARTLVGYLVSQ